MPTEKNVKIVAELAEEFKKSSLVVAANYRGLNVAVMQGVRRAVRPTNSSFKIVKNTLARIAADDAGKPELKEFIDGPIGFLVTEGDAASAAKVLVKYIDDNSIAMTIVGGALDGQVLSPERVTALAKLPPKEELIAKLLGSMNSPITGMVMVLSGPVRALAIVLQRIAEKGGAAAASAGEAETATSDTAAAADAGDAGSPEPGEAAAEPAAEN